MADELRCDNTSVGVIAKDSQGKILLIERKKFPTEFLDRLKHGQETTPSLGWAPPSGHLDGQTYPVACFNEFEEETGLKIVGAPRPMIPLNSRKYFKCRRGGEYHDWQIFEVNWKGELKPSPSEVKNIRWFSQEEVEDLAATTKWYLEMKKGPEEWMGAIERAWQISPGLEPVWYEFFKELKIIEGSA